MKNAENTDLLEAAAAVLGRNPRATMAEIARGASVGRATLFRAYGTREELMCAVEEQTIQRYVNATSAAVSREHDPLGAMRKILAEICAMAPSYGFVAARSLSGELEPRLHARAAEGESRVIGIIRAGQEAGIFRVDLSAEWISLSLSGLVIAAADGVRTGAIAVRDAPRFVEQSFLHGLLRSSPGTP